MSPGRKPGPGGRKGHAGSGCIDAAHATGARLLGACDLAPCRLHRSPAPRQRGFTLIEIVIAFAVLGMALTLLLGTLSGSAREVRDSADAGRAALHAQTLLDQVGVGETLQAGSRDGEFEDGRYRWTLQVEPYVDPTQRRRDTIEPGAARLMLLALHVEWGEGGPRQRLDLQSLRLAQPEGL